EPASILPLPLRKERPQACSSPPVSHRREREGQTMSSYGPWSSSSPTADAASAVGAVADAATAASAAISSIDPAGLYSSNLVTSALSAVGDAQFFEESISPSTVRSQLVVTGDPSNPSTTLNLLKGMKWLLANMSKGRNVSDFFPHVVKLVGVPNLEVRKMVYIYLARYANHDRACRELALLSINAFQRGLADREPLLRSLALRVLTCMDVPDVLQLQIIGVRTCCKDGSPYVRKCAANAVGKLHPRCLEAGDAAQAEQLVGIVTSLLEGDGSTMVLTSAMIAFCEICPRRLDLLHGCYRKVCHLLTDMDEWGQVVVMGALTHYCRTFFKQPRGHQKGSALEIDQERRVTRSTRKLGAAGGGGSAVSQGGSAPSGDATSDNLLSLEASTATDAAAAATNGTSASPTLPSRTRQKVKRRVVRKAFYSDEEDESSEEEVNPFFPNTGGNVAGALREPQLLGSPSEQGKSFFRDDVNASGDGGQEGNLGWKSNGGTPAAAMNDDEDDDLDEDHKLLLQSSLPLLKSRNSAVVLAACSLHYHCGIASIKIRAALGKALVRIHRDRREIQYVVLVSIRTLVQECPSAFSPFLNDFFVKGTDPSFTRMIKLDILVALCIDPKAIEAVLTELRTYVRHSDKAFACAAIRSVGKIAELARVVYDRRALTADELDATSAREKSNVIVLNCLSGLVTLSEFSRHAEVVGECAETMQRILSQLLSDDGIASSVKDPMTIQERALKRLLLILVRSLHTDDSSSDENKTAEQSQLELKAVRVPDLSVASMLWVTGEWLALPQSMLSPWNLDAKSKGKIRLEVLRLLAKSFTKMDPQIKLQAVHFASKVLSSHRADQTSSPKTSEKECAISELIISLARMDVLQDVRDRARCESNILHTALDLTFDTNAMQQPPSAASVSMDTVKSMFLHRKPNASSLPLDSKEFGNAGDQLDIFRFGTLSNILCRSIGSTSQLPKWADENNPKAADKRDPAAGDKSDDRGEKDLYSSSSDDDSSSSDESSSSSDSDSSEESEEEESSDESTDGEKDTTIGIIENGGFNDKAFLADPNQHSVAVVPSLIPGEEDSSSDSSSDDSSNSDESSESNTSTKSIGTNSEAVGTILDMEPANPPDAPEYSKQTSSGSSVAAGLEDLVMAPLVTNKDDIKPSSIDDESGAWKDFVRPELSGGLSVKMRFVHGRSKAKEARLLGVDPKNPSTICLQVHVENMRLDSGTLRHVRIVHRGGTSGGVISPSKAVTPPEIPALKKGMASTVFIGLTFSSASDRDGGMVAKFDVKSDRGTTSIEIRPTLGELLQDEVKTIGQSDFDAAANALQGIQRISSTFTLSPFSKEAFTNLPGIILQHLNLKQIGDWDGKASFVGTLPASGQEVYVDVKCDSVTGSGSLIVCSSDPMAANSIMNLLKQEALTS
ncbi:hypothetical protein ACHAWF_007809, partial [Thalassiosira exigua]